MQGASPRRRGALFVVITEPNPTGESRLGITVSKRVGDAVVRNRVKRMIREVFRRYRKRIHPPQTVLVIGRPAAATATYAQVRSELARALRIDVD
ncbi:ribonuclease P protein component [Candidatus Binatia bacterium]|nr:ribonuclease P protein component [Candidatus Binatia bacterium]